MRLNRFQTDESIDQRSALFIRDDLSSKYFQSVAQRIKCVRGVLAIFKQVAVETVGKMSRKLKSHIVERKDVQDKIREKKQLKNLWGLKTLLRIWREKTQG